MSKQTGILKKHSVVWTCKAFVKTKMSTWYSGYLFISEFISNILSKQSAALLAAHDIFIMPFHGFAIASATKDCRWCCNLSPKLIFSWPLADSSTMPLLVDLSHSNESILGLRQNKNLFTVSICWDSSFVACQTISVYPLPAPSFSFCGVVILAFCDWQITNGSIGSCSNMSLFLHRDSFIHLSCVPTIAFPDNHWMEIDPTSPVGICRAFFAPWCGNTSSLLVTSSSPAQRVERLIFVLLKPWRA